MPTFLNSSQPDFETEIEAFLTLKREEAQNVDDVVKDIIADVRARGDEAVVELTNKFDRANIAAQQMRISPDQVAEAIAPLAQKTKDALQFAHDRIQRHHEKQVPQDQSYTDKIGAQLGFRWTPIDAVGLYVPGGLASYPSSVLMNAVPARVAGVKRLAMVVPTPDGEVNPAVLYAAHLCGVDEIYRIGGAQAVAALAYGTETIAPVHKIVGPGNAFVASAKKQVFGQVGIEMIAGPSEVIVVADQSANPAWVAADLLAQAEHGAGAQAVAICLDENVGNCIADEVERQLKTLNRAEIAQEGWEEFGAIISVQNIEEAAEISNRFAPEHLELALDGAEKYIEHFRHAGAIFLGHHTPEAVGDYVGGSNHVLPTARTPKFASGLGTSEFMKRTSILGLSPQALAELADSTVTLAEEEGLQAHGRSVSIRLNSSS